MSYLFYTAILLGVLVFVHELGHFLFAKLFGVKVIRFSIGFGPRLVGFYYGETEYVICVLPLGGYVQMLGMSFEQSEDIPKEDIGRALMTKPIWQRSLIALAGPGFNLIFPIFLYFIVTLFAETTSAPAQIGQVFGDPAIAAKLEPGDKLVEIDGVPISYWHEISAEIAHRAEESFPIILERDGKRKKVMITPEAISRTDFLGTKSKLGLLGISMVTYGPTISIDDPQSPAAQSGLKDFDTVIGVNGKKIRRYDAFVSALAESQGKTLRLDVLRLKKLDTEYAEIYRREAVQVSFTPHCQIREESCKLGIASGEMTLSEVKENTPAYKDGFRQGDRILSVNGKVFHEWFRAMSAIHMKLWESALAMNDAGKKAEDVKVGFEIRFLRDGVEKTLTLNPIVKNLDFPDFEIGFSHIRNQVQPDDIDFPFSDRLPYASVYSFTQTWSFIGMTFKGLTRMLSGKMSMSNLSGPIGIGTMAAEAGKAGWDKFLKMMAVISINIALVNLIPIPILDGGNLLLYGLEAIKRGPLSFRTRQIATYIGFSLIIVLFILAFKNDIENNWAIFADWLNELF